MSTLHVESLHIHPVKSTAVQSVEVLGITSDGADGDRRYMIIDKEDHAITARDVPRLVLVMARLTERGLRLGAPGMPNLDVVDHGTRLDKVTIWANAVEDVAVLPEASDWFTKYLERPCRLVHATKASARKGPVPIIPNAFQDAGPLLVVSAASLDDLNTRLSAPVTMAHFRPNIVIAGVPAFDEDCWARFRIGDVMFEGLYGCGRCVFTTIDPVTADKLKKGEPLRSLAKYRQGNDQQAYFGQNVWVRDPGSIRVGDRVEVLERFPELKSQGDYVAGLEG